MMKLFKKFGVAGTIVAAGLMFAGCETLADDSSAPDTGLPGAGGTRWLGKSPQPARPMADRPDPKPAPRLFTGRCEPSVGPDQTLASLAFPTGDARTSAIMLHQVMPKQVRRNNEFMYEFHVCNLTDGTLQNVVVTQDSASNLSVRSSEPSGQGGAGGQNWAIGDLGPGETRIIRVNAVAQDTGMASNCISVSYNNVLCAATNVVEPALALTKTATSSALRCDEIEIVYTVTNPGTGVATDVRVIDELPEGLTTLSGNSSINAEVGTLTAGQSREIRVRAEASRAGRFSSPARATASGGLSAEAAATSTVINAPELEVVCDPRQRQVIGRDAEYTFTVSNTGNGVAANATLSVNVSGGTIVRTSSGAGAGSGANISLGNLAAGQSRDVTVVLTSSTSGVASVRATANAVCAEPATASCETEFRGIPAIVLEVVDEPGYVDAGEQYAYLIRVRNQGTANDSNIAITVEIPAETEFVSAGGATNATNRGRTVTFQPVPVLTPGQEVTWRVVVRATQEVDEEVVVYGAFEMSSDNIPTPARETEPTRLVPAE